MLKDICAFCSIIMLITAVCMWAPIVEATAR